MFGRYRPNPWERDAALLAAEQEEEAVRRAPSAPGADGDPPRSTLVVLLSL